MSAFDRFAGLSGRTFRQLSDKTGVPFDLLKVVREAAGFAEPRPEDLVRENELSELVMDAADGMSSVTFTEIGPVELKGVSGALRLHRAGRDA